MNNLYFYCILILGVFISTVWLTKNIIPKFCGIAKQPIYDGGPSWHVKKSGTPTLGGIGFIIPSFILMLTVSVFCLKSNLEYNGKSLMIASVFCFSNAMIGVIDDLTKIKHSKNAGLSPKQKLALQGITSAGFLLARAKLIGSDTKLYFGDLFVDLGPLYYLFAILFLVGIVNCANLTDGVDGLASSVAFAISSFTFLLSISRSFEASILSSIGIGATIGFLIFNIHPAKIFMGDTGSLFLGALCASYAFSLNSLPAYLLICGVYVTEGASVILQVIHFKTTGKRLFKMAPLHHHLEKCGFDESKICVYAILVTLVLSVASLTLISGGNA